MAGQLINTVIDRQAIEADKTFLIAQVREIERAVAQAKTAGISIMGAGNQKELNAAIQQQAAAQRDLAAATKQTEQAAILSARAKKAEADAAKALAQQQITEAKLRDQNARAAEREQAAKAKAAQQPIDGGTNVGGVPDIDYDAIDRRNEALRQQAILEAEAAGATAANVNQTQAAKVAMLDSKKAVDAFTESVKFQNGGLEANVEMRGMLTTHIQKLTQFQKEEAARLKDGTITRKEYTYSLVRSQSEIEKYKQKLVEVNKNIKVLSSTEKDSVNGYKMLERRFATASLEAKNFALTLGKTHPQTIEATKRAKALNDQLKELDASVGQNQRNVGNYPSAFSKAGAAFSKFLTPFRTLANILPGLGLSGIFLLAAQGIGKAVSAIGNLIMKTYEADRAAKLYRETLQRVREEAVKGSAGDVAKLEAYRVIITDVTRSQKDRTEALKAYNQIADEANKIDEKNLNSIGLVNAAINTQITLIERRALSRAAESILAEKAEALLLAQEKARVDAEKQLQNEKEITADQLAKDGVIEAQVGNIRTSQLTEYNRLLDEQRKQQIINSNSAVKTAREEFDAAKKSLFGIVDLYGFAAEERSKKEKKANDDARKSELELFKFRQQLLIDEQKLRAAIASAAGDTRGFAEARTKQAALEIALAEGVAAIELKQKKINADEIKLINEKLVQDLKQIDLSRRLDILTQASEQRQIILEESQETLDALNAQEKAFAEKRKQFAIDNLTDGFERQQRSIEENGSRELLVQARLYQEGKISKEKYEKEKLNIEYKSRRESLEAEIAYYEKLLTISNLPVDLQKKGYEQLNRLKERLRAEDIKNAEQSADKETEITKKKNEALKSLAQELSGLVTDIFISGIERQKNAVQDMIDQLEVQKQKDIEVANQTIVNAQDRTAAIQVIEARAAAQREQLERRQRELDQRRARFERARQIAEIIGNTAVAISKALPNVVLAAIVGAIGAAQVARVLVTPIPKYKHGTESHTGGPAILGDGGKPEPFRTPDGKVGISPAKDTIYDLPAGTKVWSSVDDYARSVHGQVPSFSSTSTSDYSPVVNAVGLMSKRVEKAIKRIPQTVVNTDGNWSKYMKGRHGSVSWINKNI